MEQRIESLLIENKTSNLELLKEYLYILNSESCKFLNADELKSKIRDKIAQTEQTLKLRLRIDSKMTIWVFGMVFFVLLIGSLIFFALFGLMNFFWLMGIAIMFIIILVGSNYQNFLEKKYKIDNWE